MIFYNIVDDTIKGRCCIATQSIKKDTTILVDFPIITIPRVNRKKFIIDTIKSKKNLLEKILNLAPVVNDVDINLSNFESYYEIIVKKINTNSFDFSNNSGKTVLYYNASFFNHNCEPNLDHYTDNYNDRFVCKTNRNIEAGEELSINYIGCDFDVINRQKIMLKCWNFNCTCDKCNSELLLLKKENAIKLPNNTNIQNEEIPQNIINIKNNLIKKNSKISLIIPIVITVTTFITFYVRMTNPFIFNCFIKNYR